MKKYFFQKIKIGLPFFAICAIIMSTGVWRSLVARSAGGREVAGSNPVAPIKSTFAKSRCALLLDIYTMMIPAKERETNERKKQF